MTLDDDAFLSCLSKNAYDKKSAQSKRNYMLKQGHKRLRIYLCDYADHWHLTKRPLSVDLKKYPTQKPKK